MKTLLKDMPIHMERIENNYSLQNDIRDAFLCTQIDSEEVSEISNEIMQLITDFVNTNYTFKGICKP